MTAPKATRIVRLQAERFKRLTAVDISPDGAVIQIRGKNGQGKSSVLDAIEAALGGKKSLPEKPVREGEETARIVVELDGLVVRRTFDVDGTTTIKVEATDGARYSSPQTLLDELVGKLSFDPLAFVRSDPKARAETLKSIAGVDTRKLELQRAGAYEDRTEVNREAKRLEAQASGIKVTPDAPAELVSVADIAAELEEGQRAHAEYADTQAEWKQTQHAIETADARAAEKRRAIAVLQADIATLETQAADARETLSAITAKGQQLKASLPDLAAIRAKLDGLEKTNNAVRGNLERKRLEKLALEQREKAEALTKRIDELDAAKAKAIAEAKLPVPNLSWNDDGVTLNGLPFDQASGAEKLRASVAIAAALHPTLGVILVRDGSLLDDDSFRQLAELAAEKGLQVWIERVGEGDGAGIIIEDGAVRGAPSSEAAAE